MDANEELKLRFCIKKKSAEGRERVRVNVNEDLKFL